MNSSISTGCIEAQFTINQGSDATVAYIVGLGIKACNFSGKYITEPGSGKPAGIIPGNQRRGPGGSKSAMGTPY